jgi:hypothetical protein
VSIGDCSEGVIRIGRYGSLKALDNSHAGSASKTTKYCAANRPHCGIFLWSSDSATHKSHGKYLCQ